MKKNTEKLLRLPAEKLYDKEIQHLIKAEKHPVPSGWPTYYLKYFPLSPRVASMLQ